MKGLVIFFLIIVALDVVSESFTPRRQRRPLDPVWLGSIIFLLLLLWILY